MAQARGLPVKAFGIFILAAVVGVAGGALSVGFTQLLRLFQTWFMGMPGPMAKAAEGMSELQRLVVPALGGALAGLVLLLVRNQRGPFGITEIVELVTLRKDTIQPVRSSVQILSSACSIASGASIGKEAPNSQLAATVGAILSRLFRTDTRTRAVLLGCGVAAGMACAYNAPIAGALFVMEVVLGNFAMDVFAPIVVASVGAILVQQGMTGVSDPLYKLTTKLDHPALVVSAAVLGALCGLGSIMFRRSLQFGSALFKMTRLPLLVNLTLGGLAVGAIGIWVPEVWGNGDSVLRAVKDDARLSVQFVFALMVLKVIGTAISTGSGGLGGIFTPNLVVGGALGAFFAALVHALAPELGEHRAAFTVVGMAGLCAATTHAPITAVLLIFEMTGDYGLILPLMLCSIIGSVTARLLDKDSIYTARLRAKGHYAAGIEELTMQRTYVRDLLQRDVATVPDTATFDQVMDLFTDSRRDSVLVVDAQGALLGHVHIHDIKLYINDPTLSSVVIAADLSRAVPTVTADESLAQVLPRFDDPDLDEVAVVDEQRRPIGRVTRRDVLACLSDEVLRTRQLRTKVQTDRASSYLELPRDCEIARIEISNALQDRALDSLALEQMGIVPLFTIDKLTDGTETRRLAEPGSVLVAGGALVVLGPRDAVNSLRT